jgi:hypothetical protein
VRSAPEPARCLTTVRTPERGEAERNKPGPSEALRELGIRVGGHRLERTRATDDGKAFGCRAEILHQKGDARKGASIPLCQRSAARVDRCGLLPTKVSSDVADRAQFLDGACALEGRFQGLAARRPSSTNGRTKGHTILRIECVRQNAHPRRTGISGASQPSRNYFGSRGSTGTVKPPDLIASRLASIAVIESGTTIALLNTISLPPAFMKLKEE